MITATEEYLEQIDALCEARRQQIRNLPDRLVIRGRTYYVSCEGDDKNDGLTPGTAWKTLAKVSAAELSAGDGVLFRRGDLFRGKVITCGAFPTVHTARAKNRNSMAGTEDLTIRHCGHAWIRRTTSGDGMRRFWIPVHWYSITGRLIHSS